MHDENSKTVVVSSINAIKFTIKGKKEGENLLLPETTRSTDKL